MFILCGTGHGRAVFGSITSLLFAEAVLHSGRILEGTRLRLERLDRQRLQIDGLVVEPVTFRVIQRMLHPVDIVAGRKVAMRMRAARFLAGCCRCDGGLRGFDQVVQFECLDARRIEDLGLVLERDVLAPLVELHDLPIAALQQLVGAKHTAEMLHRRANVVGHVLHPFTAGAGFEMRKTR